MTKAQAKNYRTEWNKALREGRVVRINGGLSLRSFPTVEATMAFLVEAAKAGMVAEIVRIEES